MTHVSYLNASHGQRLLGKLLRSNAQEEELGIFRHAKSRLIPTATQLEMQGPVVNFVVLNTPSMDVGDLLPTSVVTCWHDDNGHRLVLKCKDMFHLTILTQGASGAHLWSARLHVLPLLFTAVPMEFFCCFTNWDVEPTRPLCCEGPKTSNAVLACRW